MTMLSVVVVGPSMSGKTRLCMSLSEQHSSSLGTTCSASSVCISVNDREWHVWDTPAVLAAEIVNSSESWLAHDVLREANVVVVCHDGRPESKGPIPLVRACGVDRCIIVRTRGSSSYHDLPFFLDYLKTSTSDGSLVPIVNPGADLLYSVNRLALSQRQTKDLQGFVELE